MNLINFFLFLPFTFEINLNCNFKNLEYFPFSYIEYIEIDFCFDEKLSKCYPTILDLSSINIFLFNHDLTKYGYKSINNFKSKIIVNKIINKNNLLLKGNELNDNIQLNKNNIPFNFILINECSLDLNKFQFSGFFGLSLKKENKKTNSLLESLKDRNLISKKNIEILYKSKTNIQLILDSEIKNKNYKFCPISFNQNLNETYLISCSLDSLIFSKNKTIINTYYFVDVIFDSFNDIIQAPEPMGYDLFKIFMDESNGQCKVKFDNLYNGHFLECEKNFNLYNLSSVSLKMNNVEIDLNINDIFDIKSKKSRIYIIKYSNVWIINMNILKNYNLFLNYENFSIGFEKNNINFQRTQNNKYIYYFCMICLIITLFGLFLNLMIYLSLKNKKEY